MELLMLSPMTPNGRLKTFGSLRNGTLKRSIRNHLGEVICLMASCHPLKESNFVKNNPLFDSFIFLLVYKNVSFWTAPQSPFYLLNWMLPDSNRFLLSLKKVIRLFISIVVTNNKKWELKETTPAHNPPPPDTHTAPWAMSNRIQYLLNPERARGLFLLRRCWVWPSPSLCCFFLRNMALLERLFSRLRA